MKENETAEASAAPVSETLAFSAEAEFDRTEAGTGVGMGTGTDPDPDTGTGTGTEPAGEEIHGSPPPSSPKPQVRSADNARRVRKKALKRRRSNQEKHRGAIDNDNSDKVSNTDDDDDGDGSWGRGQRGGGGGGGGGGSGGDADADVGHVPGGAAAAAGVLTDHRATDGHEGDGGEGGEEEEVCTVTGPCVWCERDEMGLEYCMETSRRQEVGGCLPGSWFEGGF